MTKQRLSLNLTTKIVVMMELAYNLWRVKFFSQAPALKGCAISMII